MHEYCRPREAHEECGAEGPESSRNDREGLMRFSPGEWVENGG
jgi:hypothetical protein